MGRWDGHTGTFLGAVTVGENGVAGYADGGGTLLVAGGTGRVYSLRLDQEEWVRSACAMAGRELAAAEWRSYLPDRAPLQVCAT